MGNRSVVVDEGGERRDRRRGRDDRALGIIDRDQGLRRFRRHGLDDALLGDGQREQHGRNDHDQPGEGRYGLQQRLERRDKHDDADYRSSARHEHHSGSTYQMAARENLGERVSPFATQQELFHREGSESNLDDGEDEGPKYDDSNHDGEDEGPKYDDWDNDDNSDELETGYEDFNFSKIVQQLNDHRPKGLIIESEYDGPPPKYDEEVEEYEGTDGMGAKVHEAGFSFNQLGDELVLQKGDEYNSPPKYNEEDEKTEMRTKRETEIQDVLTSFIHLGEREVNQQGAAALFVLSCNIFAPGRDNAECLFVEVSKLVYILGSGRTTAQREDMCVKPSFSGKLLGKKMHRWYRFG